MSTIEGSHSTAQSKNSRYFFTQSCLDVELVPAVEVPEEEDPLDGEGEGAGGQVEVGGHGAGRGHLVEVHQLEEAGEPEEGEHGHVLTVVHLSRMKRRLMVSQCGYAYLHMYTI